MEDYLGKAVDALLKKARGQIPVIKDINLRKPLRRSTTVIYHGINWRVEGVYRRGRPARYYLKNGDPGYPAEPSELLDVCIFAEGRHGHSDDMQDILTMEAQDKLVDWALEQFDDHDQTEDIPW